MAEQTNKASALLASANVNAIIYACTTGSLVGGVSWERKLVKLIENGSGARASTTAGAVLEALRKIGANRIAVATPYSDELNLDEKKFFESSGFKVTKIQGLGYTKGEELHREPPSTTRRLAKQVNDPVSDAIFLSCTDLKTFTVIRELEEELRKPVVSSNSASLWKALKLLGVREKISSLGMLLE